MTVRNLEFMFKPSSVALLGASKRPQSVGAVVARNLLRAGFDGPVMPVDPHSRAVEGVLAYPDVASLPMAPDLAVIATPPETLPGLIADLGRRGTKAAVVIPSGFGDGERPTRAQQQAMLAAAQPHLLRLLGPHCLGLMVPGLRLNASFGQVAPLEGDLAFIGQSAAVIASVLDWAAGKGIGFSHMVSLGDMADVDFGDLLDYFAADPNTRAILLYIEAVTHARKFMSAARAAARLKPIVVIKAGRHAEAAGAATTHTGALAEADAIYDTAFRRAGMLRVDDLDELFDAVATLAAHPQAFGDRLAIVTNGGGVAVLATDTLIRRGGRLATLSAETLMWLNHVLPPNWSHGNPVDISDHASPERYADALEAVFADPGVDAVLVLHCPTALASGEDAAKAVIRAIGDKRRVVLTSWLGEAGAASARRRFTRARLPTYETPDKAVRGFMHLVQYQRNQEMLMQTPPSVPAFAVDVGAARGVIDGVLRGGRRWLDQTETQAVLAAYGIPVAETRIAEGPADALAAARFIGGPVALKILSPDVVHKSDVGGVVLDLQPHQVQQAAADMTARLHRLRPDAKLAGFAVQAMVRRPSSHELILGMIDDPQFGPAILFGQGGTAVEIVNDKALALPPLNLGLARELMSRTRVFRLLQGFSDHPPADIDAVALTLVKLSQLVTDIAEIVELDINPLIADEKGVVALDARIRVAEPDPAVAAAPAARLAIRPYPQELEQTVDWDGMKLRLRPVRPEDEPSFRSGFARLSAEDVRMRFFAPMSYLPHAMAARLTQLDYDREMAFIAERLGIDGAPEIAGVVRLSADPDNRRAEFAVVVVSDLKGRGLGRLLLGHLIEYARARGLGELFGDVLGENAGMLKLAAHFGFDAQEIADGPSIVRVTLKL